MVRVGVARVVVERVTAVVPAVLGGDGHRLRRGAVHPHVDRGVPARSRGVVRQRVAEGHGVRGRREGELHVLADGVQRHGLPAGRLRGQRAVEAVGADQRAVGGGVLGFLLLERDGRTATGDRQGGGGGDPRRLGGRSAGQDRGGGDAERGECQRERGGQGSSEQWASGWWGHVTVVLAVRGGSADAHRLGAATQGSPRWCAKFCFNYSKMRLKPVRNECSEGIGYAWSPSGEAGGAPTAMPRRGCGAAADSVRRAVECSAEPSFGAQNIRTRSEEHGVEGCPCGGAVRKPVQVVSLLIPYAAWRVSAFLGSGALESVLHRFAEWGFACPAVLLCSRSPSARKGKAPEPDNCAGSSVCSWTADSRCAER